MTNILMDILATKHREVEQAKIHLSLAQLRAALQDAPPLRDFVGSVRAKLQQQQSAVIAEVKKASPSKGVIRENFAPVDIARDYEKHGAACLSVLTDKQYFQGALEDLRQIRAAVAIPLLRKDFIIDEYQVIEARLAGADCILLIVAALALNQLHRLAQVAHDLGLAVLIEVHNEAELDCALTLSSPLIGINNRDLKTFTVDLETTVRLRAAIPADRIVITESGIMQPQDVAYMNQHHIHTFLIGEHFMRHPFPGEAMKALFASSF